MARTHARKTRVREGLAAGLLDSLRERAVGAVRLQQALPAPEHQGEGLLILEVRVELGNPGRLARGGQIEEDAGKELEDGHHVEPHLQRVGVGRAEPPEAKLHGQHGIHVRRHRGEERAGAHGGGQGRHVHALSLEVAGQEGEENGLEVGEVRGVREAAAAEEELLVHQREAQLVRSHGGRDGARLSRECRELEGALHARWAGLGPGRQERRGTESGENGRGDLEDVVVGHRVGVTRCAGARGGPRHGGQRRVREASGGATSWAAGAAFSVARVGILVLPGGAAGLVGPAGDPGCVAAIATITVIRQDAQRGRIIRAEALHRGGRADPAEQEALDGRAGRGAEHEHFGQGTNRRGAHGLQHGGEGFGRGKAGEAKCFGGIVGGAVGSGRGRGRGELRGVEPLEGCTVLGREKEVDGSGNGRREGDGGS